MDDFISVLCESISTNGLWATFSSCIPLLALAVLFGLGVFFIVRIIRKLISLRFGI